MEIVTWVLEGALAHADSLGTRSVIHPDELQRMSAGTGVSHSEVNASSSALVHFLQIWIVPRSTGLAPGASLVHPLASGRHAWVQVTRGSVAIGGEHRGAGDGAAISDSARLELTGAGSAGAEPTALLVFDLA
jgi:redox-sensitive bicupin YhaK (pirin superfamily)